MSFADANLARNLCFNPGLLPLVEPGRHCCWSWRCAGHTHTIYKHGIEDPPPETIGVGLHGPMSGLRWFLCVDDGISIARRPGAYLSQT